MNKNLSRISYGPLPKKKITGPTVTVMKWKDVKTFNKPGLKIACALPLDSSKSLAADLKRALELRQQRLLKKYSPLGMPKRGRRYAINSLNMRDVRRGRGVNPELRRILGSGVCYSPSGHERYSGFDVEKDFDDDGTPVIVIIRADDEMDVPEYKTRHVRRSEWKEKAKKKTPPDEGDDTSNHYFLKAPLNDQMLIEAMKTADLKMTAGEHVGYQKWMENKEQHRKEFNNCHLLVCLFFYVYIKQLYANAGFYGRKKAFFDYCEGALGKDFNLKSYRSFFKNIEKLQLRKDSFEDYIKGRVDPAPNREKGLANLYFWHELYIQASGHFKSAFSTGSAQ